MEKMNTEDGQLFIKNLASFVRAHEKALANALQLRRQSVPNAAYRGSSGGATSATSALAAALSFGALKFTTHHVKPAKLTLTPHHLFYLLSRFEELGINVGAMNVRLENIHIESSVSYVSFLNRPRRSRGDRDSIHSVSSVRSVMSGISSLWSSFGIGSRDGMKSDKAKAALEADLKYLYSAFTKIPCLRLAPDHRARLIRGYEEFPLDTAVPLHVFKNLGALEIIDIDFRSFYGWDRLSEQLRTLTLKRANLDDPADLLTKIVLDDMDKRRLRSSKTQPSPVLGGANPSKSNSAPGSPRQDSNMATSSSPKSASMMRAQSDGERGHRRTGSYSPTRPTTARSSAPRHARRQSMKMARSGSGSSNSSEVSLHGKRSSSTLLTDVLPPSKWRFLRHLGLPDNSLTSISADAFAPVANTLHSLDLSSNLFTEVPDCLASLVSLRALNLSNCMIDSLRSLSKNPLPAITALNLRGNRLSSLAGIERLLSLERVDLRDNALTDPSEIARLTGLPEIREIWVAGNPFTKTHRGYRVTIFNLFRQTPGYSEDIIIDSTGPGYSERKQLIDRVAEPESAPVVRPADPQPTHTVSRGAAQAVGQPSTETSATPVQEGTNRRRKNHRRRHVVDVTREESNSAQNTLNTEIPRLTIASKSQADPFTNGAAVEAVSPTTVSLLSGTEAISQALTAKPIDSAQEEPPFKTLEWTTTGESFRQRIEALQHDVGHGWLNDLGEDGWPKERVRSASIAVPRTGPGLDGPIIPPDPVSRSNSQVMVHGGGPVD
ncbi:hypothetical protein VTN31DRAFT_1905 [Thermomyces dupontii]|uniref:uncharacterized protein n=1 Tax=Talaromyces thermophilus TaxID=28565 RepID=UPI0037443025